MNFTGFEQAQRRMKEIGSIGGIPIGMDYSRIAPQVEELDHIDEETLLDVLAFTRRQVRKEDIILLVYLDSSCEIEDGLLFTKQGMFYWEGQGNKKRENIPYEQIEEVDFTEDSVVVKYQGVSLTIYLGEDAEEEKYPRYMYNFIMELLEHNRE